MLPDLHTHPQPPNHKVIVKNASRMLVLGVVCPRKCGRARATWSAQWRTQEFCSGGGVQQIQLKTEDRENGDLGALAP